MTVLPNIITGANAGHVSCQCGYAGPPASLSSGDRRKGMRGFLTTDDTDFTDAAGLFLSVHSV